MKPTVENAAIATNGVFLSEYPIDRLKSKKFRDLPHMLGFQRDEVLSYTTSNITRLFNQPH